MGLVRAGLRQGIIRDKEHTRGGKGTSSGCWC